MYNIDIIHVYPYIADIVMTTTPKNGSETNKDRDSATDVSTSETGVPDSISDNPQKNAGTYLLLPLVSNMQA